MKIPFSNPHTERQPEKRRAAAKLELDVSTKYVIPTLAAREQTHMAFPERMNEFYGLAHVARHPCDENQGGNRHVCPKRDLVCNTRWNYQYHENCVLTSAHFCHIVLSVI